MSIPRSTMTKTTVVASGVWLCYLLQFSPVVAQSSDVCVFGGTSFVPGENLGDAFATRCGSSDEWPCFCNPDLENNAECPYCGFSTWDGTLYCARDGQNITFQDGSISRACTCEIPDDPTQPAIRDCVVVASEAGCNWFDLEGNEVFYKNGESFGDTIDGACGPALDWPSYCYVPPGSSGGDDFLIDYPYCVFSDTDSGTAVCAKDGEKVEYVDRNGTKLSCDCTYTSEGGPNPTCERVPGGSPAGSQAPGASPQPTPAPAKPKPSGAAPRRGGEGAMVAMSILAMLAFCFHSLC